jgi:hypothetical protein
MIEVEGVSKRFGSTQAALYWLWQALAWIAGALVVFFVIAPRLYRSSSG